MHFLLRWCDEGDCSAISRNWSRSEWIRRRLQIICFWFRLHNVSSAQSSKKHRVVHYYDAQWAILWQLKTCSAQQQYVGTNLREVRWRDWHVCRGSPMKNHLNRLHVWHLKALLRALLLIVFVNRRVDRGSYWQTGRMAFLKRFLLHLELWAFYNDLWARLKVQLYGANEIL